MPTLCIPTVRTYGWKEAWLSVLFPFIIFQAAAARLLARLSPPRQGAATPNNDKPPRWPTPISTTAMPSLVRNRRRDLTWRGPPDPGAPAAPRRGHSAVAGVSHRRRSQPGGSARSRRPTGRPDPSTAFLWKTPWGRSSWRSSSGRLSSFSSSWPFWAIAWLWPFTRRSRPRTRTRPTWYW